MLDQYRVLMLAARAYGCKQTEEQPMPGPEPGVEASKRIHLETSPARPETGQLLLARQPQEDAGSHWV